MTNMIIIIWIACLSFNLTFIMASMHRTNPKGEGSDEILVAASILVAPLVTLILIGYALTKTKK